jgi:hypothetical protein
MITESKKFAYRGSLLALLAVFALVFVAGMIGERIDRSQSHLEKAEGFVADLHAIATGVPRSLDGAILRQGQLSTAWLDATGALPMRLQAMAGTLRGGEGQPSLGLVLRGPWSFAFTVEARNSLMWAQLPGVPKTVCQQFARTIIRHPDQAAYISAGGNPAVIPAVQDLNWMCNQNFNNLAVITLDPQTEARRLSADIQNAVKAFRAGSAEKMPISGSSAPFQVVGGQDVGPGFIQNDQSRIRVTINNVPFAVCRLALMLGPEAFGMEAFETSDGTAAPSPSTGPAPEALCTALKGRLVMTSSRAG